MIERIDELQVFVRAVDTSSLSAAARSLGISANQASRKIAKLEARLGARLLARTTRRMQLTDEGRSVYVHAQRLLDEVGCIESRVRSRGAELSGPVRLGVPAICVRHGLLEDLHHMLDQHSELSVQVHIADPVPDLLQGGYDVGVYIGSLPDSTHIASRLGRIVPILAAAPAYVARHGSPQSPAQLRGHRCLRLLQGHEPQTHWTLIGPDAREHRVPVLGRFATADTRTLVDAVTAGLGIGRVSDHLLQAGIRAGTMVPVLPDYTLRPLPLFALTPSRCHQLPRVQHVIELLRTLITRSSRAGLRESGRGPAIGSP